MVKLHTRNIKIDYMLKKLDIKRCCDNMCYNYLGSNMSYVGLDFLVRTRWI